MKPFSVKVLVDMVAPPPGLELLVFGYFGVFLVGLGLGIIPFLGPSNMVIAFLFTVFWPWGVPLAEVPMEALLLNVLLVSLAISLGVSLAKAIHYYLMMQSRRLMSQKRREGLDLARSRIGRWASVAVFLAASTPIPDEPIVFTVALMKYSWVKFLLSFFLGKITITIAGGVVGILMGPVLTEIAGGDIMIILSIALTVILTGVLLAWSFEKAAKRSKEEEPDSGKKKHVKTEDTNAETKDGAR